MRIYINVFFYLSVSIKMNFMVKLYAVIVGADPRVRLGNVNRINYTIRFYRDKRTFNSAHKNTYDI